MEQYHRDIIKNRLGDLIEATFHLESIVKKLLEFNIINDWMENHILNGREDSSEKKKMKLYKLIQGRGPTAFEFLCIVLKETDNIKALNILQSSDQREGPGSDNKLNTAFNNMNLENGDSYVKIHPEGKLMGTEIEHYLYGVYSMGSHPKGYALIININNIKYNDERIGSSVDMDNLKQLFTCLGFIVDPRVDLTEKEIKDVIKEFVKICHNNKAQSIVVFIMSHGEAGKDSRSADILTADGSTINTDWIIQQFVPNVCKNIPKLFFVQACRGENSDFGWRYADGQNNSIQNDSSDINNRNNSPMATIFNRCYEDVFIAYATVPGYTAKRDPTDGSWFVQKVCEVFRERAYNTDLLAMMGMVDMRVKKLNSVEHGFQTVEWTSRGFNKKFYFNPGIYNDNADYGTSKTNANIQTDV